MSIDGPNISPITGSCVIPTNGGSCSFSSPFNLSAGKYTIYIELNANCSYYKEICIEDIDQTIISEQGGGLGFNDHLQQSNSSSGQGVFLNAGTELEWRFEPFNVADRMKITVNGTDIVDTGSVTQCSQSECNLGMCFKCSECSIPDIDIAACSCSDLYLGDLTPGPISLVIGNGIFDSNCNLVGSVTLQSSGTVQIEVDGTSCPVSGGTRWEVEVCCGDNQSGISCIGSIPLNTGIIEAECTASLIANIQSNVTDNSANISFSTAGCYNSIVIEYRPYGNPQWSSVNANTSPEVLSNLISGTVYEYRIIVTCCDGTIYTSEAYTFYTDACAQMIDVENDSSLGYIVPGLYEYDIYVKSNDLTQTGTFVTFHGGEYVELYGGFCAELGANFIADIEDCNTTTQPLISDTSSIIVNNKILVNLLDESQVSLEIIDSKYKVVSRPLNMKKLDSGSHKIELDKNLLKGVYLIKVNIDGEIKFGKLLIQK